MLLKYLQKINESLYKKNLSRINKIISINNGILNFLSIQHGSGQLKDEIKAKLKSLTVSGLDEIHQGIIMLEIIINTFANSYDSSVVQVVDQLKNIKDVLNHRLASSESYKDGPALVQS